MERIRAGHIDQTVHFHIFSMVLLTLFEHNLLAYIISFYRVSTKSNIFAPFPDPMLEESGKQWDSINLYFKHFNKRTVHSLNR